MYSFSQWLSKILYAIALHFIHVYNILRWRIQCFLKKLNFFTWPVKKYRSQFRLPNLHTGKYLGIFPKDNNHGAMTCVQIKESRFKRTTWLQGWLNFSYFWGWSDECQELLEIYWLKVSYLFVVALKHWRSWKLSKAGL